MRHRSTFLLMAGPYLGVPILMIDRRRLRASWRAILRPYARSGAVLAACGMLGGGTWDQRLGWSLTLGMLFTIPAIPVLALGPRLARAR